MFGFTTTSPLSVAWGFWTTFRWRGELEQKPSGVDKSIGTPPIFLRLGQKIFDPRWTWGSWTTKSYIISRCDLFERPKIRSVRFMRDSIVCVIDPSQPFLFRPGESRSRRHYWQTSHTLQNREQSQIKAQESRSDRQD